MTREEAIELLKTRHGDAPDWEQIVWLLRSKQLDSLQAGDWEVAVDVIERTRMTMKQEPPGAAPRAGMHAPDRAMRRSRR